MDAAAILAIPESQPERLFPNSEDEAKSLFRDMAKRWHPDVNKDPQAQAVFDRLNKLYDNVLDKIRNKTWSKPGELSILGKDGKTRVIKYRRKRTFELGEMAYGNGVLCYIVRPDAKDLFGRGLETIKHSLTYKDDKIKREIERYLPAVLDSFETDNGSSVLVLAKTPDVFLLQDVLDFMGPLDPKHVSWIMSSFHNLACYLQSIGMTHNAISTTTCFISPTYHSGLLFGGWWYARKTGSDLIALPGYSAKNCPTDIIKSKIADPRLDLSLIRQMGLDCLGDSTGVNLLHDGKTPKPLVNFLRLSSNGNAFEDYKKWEQVRSDSFGKRRFVEMKVEASDIYKE